MTALTAMTTMTTTTTPAASKDVSATSNVLCTPARIASFSKVSLSQFVIDISNHLNVDKLLTDAGYEVDSDNASFSYQEYFEAIYDAISIPERSTSCSAGFDFKSPISFNLAPGKSIIVPTGIRVKMNPAYVLMLYPRSSIGIKHGIVFANTVPIIDADYYNAENEGHIMLAFKNTMPAGKNNVWHVKAGDKICQGIFVRYGITRDDHVSNVRTGGIGSTGK